ncbi:MAG: phosphotransferase family protein [Dehalococcoidia bacterium]
MVQPDRVAEYLRSKLPHATGLTVDNVHRIPGGASRETWGLDASWREDGATVTRPLVIRRDPPASLLDTDRDVEFRVMAAVRPHGVPVPETLWLEEDPAWLDRPFFVMERVLGCEASAQKLAYEPRFVAVHAALAQSFTDVLARIHSLDPEELDLGFPEPAPAADRCGLAEIEKWEAVLDREAMDPQPVLRAAFRWMRSNLPVPAQRIVLVHADYRTGNFLYNEQGEIRAFLDWEMAHLGDPLEDVAWACIRPWRWAGDERIGGLMPRADFYRMYEDATGLKIDEQAILFWEVLGNVKLAAIFLTGARSFAEGRTSSMTMAMVGRSVNRLELEVMDLMGV